MNEIKKNFCSELREYHNQGFTMAEIGKMHGITEQCVSLYISQLRKWEQIEADSLYQAIYSKTLNESLSMGIYSRLKRGGISSLEELMEKDIDEISHIRQIGKKSIDVIQKIKS